MWHQRIAQTGFVVVSCDDDDDNDDNEDLHLSAMFSLSNSHIPINNL